MAGPIEGPPATLALLVRIASGVVFVAFGVGKFASHRTEVESFEDYGLPSPDAFTYAIGVLLLAMGFLIWVGPGRGALDRRLADQPAGS